MKQPLGLVVLLFAMGIVAGRWLEPPPSTTLVAAAAAALLAIVRGPFRSAVLGLALFLGGLANLAWRLPPLAPTDLRLLSPASGEIVTLRGRLARSPELRLYDRDGALTTNTLAVVDSVALVRENSRAGPASGRVLVFTAAPLPTDLPAGTEVQVRGVLREPAGPVAPGMFNFREHLLWRGIHRELRASSEADWEGLADNRPPPGFNERFQAWAQRALSHGLPRMDAELMLMWAMALGWKTGLTDELEEPFMRSGTMHLFAISGMHIALIAGVLIQVLRFVQMPRAMCGLLTIPLLWWYTAATGWQSSAIRATIMSTVVVGGWALHRPGDLLNSLAAAALIILAWDPRQLFQAGFQLSFGVVASLGLLLPILKGFRERIWAVDPLLPAELVPRWRRAVERLGGLIYADLSVSIAAWLGSLPLTAHYFHLFTPVSLLANALVVPLGSLALVCNFASLVCYAWAPWASALFNHSGWLWMHWALGVSRWCAERPWGIWNVASPPIALTVLWFGGMATIGFAWWQRKGARPWLATAGTTLSIWAVVDWQARMTGTRLTIVPLQGGHAVFVQARGAPGPLLVDTGNARSAEAVVTPFLQAAGVDRLAALALTHGDIRHVGGASNLISRFRPRVVLASPLRFRSGAYRALITALETNAISRLHRVADGDAWRQWRVVHPARDDTFARADDGSLVLVSDVLRGGVSLLGDLGRDGQERLFERHAELRAALLVSGPAADGQFLADGLLELLHPALVVVADSPLPATGRAGPELRARLAGGEFLTLFLSETGGIELRQRRGFWEVRDPNGALLHRIPSAAQVARQTNLP